MTYPEIAVIYKAMAKSLFYKPLAILIIEESYLQRFFHTLWSNGSSGTHYPAIIGSFVILAGISILNLTLQKKTRLWIWTAVILCFILFNLFFTYM